MTFNPDDKVWYFTTRNPKKEDDIEELWGDFNCDKIYIACDDYQFIEDEIELFRLKVYKSKEDAITDLLGHLNNE